MKFVIGKLEIYIRITRMEELCVTGDAAVKVNVIFYSDIID